MDQTSARAVYSNMEQYRWSIEGEVNIEVCQIEAWWFSRKKPAFGPVTWGRVKGVHEFLLPVPYCDINDCTSISITKNLPCNMNDCDLDLVSSFMVRSVMHPVCLHSAESAYDLRQIIYSSKCMHNIVIIAPFFKHQDIQIHK